MSTLLLRLAAPLQSWGNESNFERRATHREPTKSGVVGLLAAALGRSRDENIDDLAKLRFGVRVDKSGQIIRDYHTARLFKYDGKQDKPKHDRTYVTERYYLSDAVFLVGLEGEKAFLKELENALNSPYYPLFLGRRACPPTGRLIMGIRDSALEDALTNEQWLSSEKPTKITIFMDSSEPTENRRRDVPVSFSQTHRKHAYRYIKEV